MLESHNHSVFNTRVWNVKCNPWWWLVSDESQRAARRKARKEDMKLSLLFALSIAPLLSASPFSINEAVFDVVAYGAKCDGVTDDTAAFNRTISAWQGIRNPKGGGGILYIPRSYGACVVTGGSINFASGNNGGWLRWIEDNSLLVKNSPIRMIGTINIHFEGRTGSALGLFGAGYSDGGTTWETDGNFPALILQGGNGRTTGASVESIAFDNFNFELNRDSGACAVQIQDDPGGSGYGVAKINFRNVIASTNSGPSICTNPHDKNAVVGFGLWCENCSITQGASFYNFGSIHITGNSFVGRKTILLQNKGISVMMDFKFEGIDSEGLKNTPFLTINSTSGDIWNVVLDRVAVSDSTGDSYLIKNTGTHTLDVEIFASYSSSGVIDPVSTPQGINALFCVGGYNQCALVPSQSLGETNSAAIFPLSGPHYFYVPFTGYPAVVANGGFACPLKTVHTDYAVTYSDCWVNIASRATITVPHAWYASPSKGGVSSEWHLFNSSLEPVTVQADSGTINGASQITLPSNTGKAVSCDDANCFAH
jgi:hypothetical protein